MTKKINFVGMIAADFTEDWIRKHFDIDKERIEKQPTRFKLDLDLNFPPLPLHVALEEMERTVLETVASSKHRMDGITLCLESFTDHDAKTTFLEIVGIKLTAETDDEVISRLIKNTVRQYERNHAKLVENNARIAEQLKRDAWLIRDKQDTLRLKRKLYEELKKEFESDDPNAE